MSDYSQVTDFSAKDALATGNANKKIRGSDVDGEFSAISTAIATKIDEPSSPATNALLQYNGSAWVANASITTLPGYAGKMALVDSTFAISCTTTVATITITHMLGQSSSVPDEWITLSGSPTVDVAGGVGAGGIDTGAFAADTWYRIYVIYGSSPGTSAIASTAAIGTGPTLPAGYTHFGFVGAVKVDSGGSNFIIFQQEGAHAWRRYVADTSNDGSQAFSAAAPASFTALDVSEQVPPDAVQMSGFVSLVTSTGNFAYELAEDANALGTQFFYAGVTTSNTLGQAFTRPILSTSLQHRLSAGTGTVTVGINGWSFV